MTHGATWQKIRFSLFCLIKSTAMHKQHIYISTFFLKHAKVTLNLPAMLDIKRKKLNVY